MLRHPGEEGLNPAMRRAPPFTGLFQDSRSQSLDIHNEWFRHRYGYGVAKTGAVRGVRPGTQTVSADLTLTTIGLIPPSMAMWAPGWLRPLPRSIGAWFTFSTHPRLHLCPHFFGIGRSRCFRYPKAADHPKTPGLAVEFPDA